MPDILGATNPVPGHDRTNVNRNIPLPQTNEHVHNVPNTERVVRPDGRAGQQEGSAQSDDKIRYDSHFQVFLKRLRETPDAAESLRRIFAGNMPQVASGLHAGSAQELAELFSLLQVDETQLLQFLMDQLKGDSQFGGALFAMLRNACRRSGPGAVQEGVLRFIKAYLDHFSAQRVEGNILRDLAQMADAMPASWAERLREMTARLEGLMQSGARQESLQCIKEEIIPFMSQYVGRSHDMGLPRNLLTMLTLELTRYENAGEETLLEAFHLVKGQGTLRQQLAGVDDQMLMSLLKRSQHHSESQAARFADRLAEKASQALRGNGSMESQEVFQQLVRAILINESVYMPVNHYLLPLQVENRMLFSELWVDPDADEDRDQGSRQGNAMRFLFKMDVEGLGLIDLILSSRGDEVELKLSCPETLLPFSKMIEQDMDGILRQNELVPTRVSVRRMTKPTLLTEVFPKIFERKDSLDVKV